MNCRTVLKGLSMTFVALAFSMVALAAGNVVEYTYDAVGNITQIKRLGASSLAITGFSPASGEAGAQVTIYGSGFSATPSGNTVRFNGTLATVSESNAGSISTTVPSGATTGRITVTVAGSTATSAQDFVVISNAPTIAGFSPASGVAGNTITVTGTKFETGTGATTVRLNNTIAVATVTDAQNLTMTVPANTASGRITATTAFGTGTSQQDFLVPPPGIAVVDIVTTAHLETGGAPRTVTVNTPSKHALLLFDGVAGGYYTMQFRQLASSPSSATLAYKVVKPDNTVLVSGWVGGSYRPSIHFPSLPTNGTYSVVVSPGTATFNANVTVAADPVVTVDGSAVASGIDTAYQSARFVVDAGANQRLGIGVLGVNTLPSGTANLGFAAYMPNGTAMSTTPLPYCYGPTSLNTAGDCEGELAATVAGKYTLVALPATNTISNFTLQLSSEVTGTLLPDATQDLALTRRGQDARFTFTAQAGDSFGLDLSSIVTTGQAQSFAVNIYRADGSYLTGCNGSPTISGYCELGMLTAGTYAVAIDPGFAASGAAKVTLKQGALLSGTESAAPMVASNPGESARFRVNVTAGQGVGVAVFDFAYVGSSGTGSYVQFYKPDRSQATSPATCTPTAAGGRCKVVLQNPTVSGVYSVVALPPTPVRVTGNVQVSNDLVGTLVVGTAQAIDATRSGQNAKYTFAGTAGDSLAVKAYGITGPAAANSVALFVYHPNGNLLHATSTSSGVAFNYASLPATGNYTVRLEPFYGQPWQGQVMVDAGTMLALDGAMATPASSALAEPIRYRFAGTAGQRVEVGMSGITFTPATTQGMNMTLYRPDGTQLNSTPCYSSAPQSCEMVTASLPSTGTYSVMLTPPTSLAATAFALSTPLTGTIVVGDPVQTVSIARPGQTARLTFAGTAAQLLRLNWAGTTVSGGTWAGVTVLRPDGSTHATGSFYTNQTGGMDIPSLTVTGNYTIVFDPSSGATMSAPVTLVTR